MIDFEKYKTFFNEQPLEEFCGLSPDQMNQILYSQK